MTVLEVLKRSRFLMKPRTQSSAMRYPEVSKLVKAIRAANKMSQSEFSEASGIKVATLQTWEAGYKRPGYESLKKLEAMRK